MNNKILVIGDVMLDHYILGDCDRISPEAPVPIVNVKQEKYSLGGAANVALNLSNLGASIDLFGTIGMDGDGQVFKNLLSNSNIGNLCFESDVCTTVKTRVMSSNQQMLRIDREEIFQNHLASTKALESIFDDGDYHFVVVSDYAKGICSPSFMTSLHELVKKKNIRLLVDPKGKDWNKYRGAFLVKPNLKELEDIGNIKIGNDDDLFNQVALDTANEYEIQNLVITRGKRGIYHVYDAQINHYQAEEVEIYDVSGAGDTAMAAMTFMLLNGHSMAEALTMANKAAGFAVTRLFTYALTKDDFDNI